MAIFKSVKGVSKSYAGLKRVLDYVTREKDGEKKEQEVYKITGLNCSDNAKDCYKEFVMCKEIHENTKGRQYRHHLQSFKAGEVTPELAHKIAQEFAEKNYKGFQVLIVTHMDKEHIHTHFIINSVSMETGRKFRELNAKEIKAKEKNKEEYKSYEFSLEKLKESSDLLCAEKGLSVIDRSKGAKSINIYDKKKYYVYKNHIDGKQKSYKIELAKSIVNLAERCTSKAEFINELKKQNIDVDWKDTRKHVVFKFIQKEGEKKKRNIRLETLKNDIGIDIFDKEKLIQSFNKNAEFEIAYNKQKELQKQQELERERRRVQEVEKQRYLEQIRQAELQKEKEKKEQEEREIQHQREVQKLQEQYNKEKEEEKYNNEKQEKEEEQKQEITKDTEEKVAEKKKITIPKKRNTITQKKTTYDYNETTKSWTKKTTTWSDKTKKRNGIER